MLLCLFQNYANTTLQHVLNLCLDMQCRCVDHFSSGWGTSRGYRLCSQCIHLGSYSVGLYSVTTVNEMCEF